MCTSLTLMTADHQNLFARTMDFPTKTPWKLTYIPTNYEWQPKTENVTFTGKHAFLGGMRAIDGRFLIGDGINDAGLCCAELYFPVEAKYYSENQHGKINLSPQDFITWVLSENDSINSVVQKLPEIALIGIEWFDHDGIYPFHWMLTDQSGDMLVIEPTDLQLTATFNPTHVLTNTPNLAKHIANLNRFLHTDSTDFDMTTIAALQNYHGPIPEKHIPTDRFIKTNIALRQRGHEEEIPWTFGLLDSVKIEKTNDRHDYTHYEGIINTKTTDYYFRDVATGRTIHRNLHDLIDQFDQPQVFNEEAVL